MKIYLITAVVSLFLIASAVGDDLYKITIDSPAKARALRALDVDPLFQAADGYLVLCPESLSEKLAASGLEAQLLASGLSRDQLALDARRDRVNANRFPVLYQEGQVRLLRIEGGLASLDGKAVEVYPLVDSPPGIVFRPQSSDRTPRFPAAIAADLPDLMDSVKQANLRSYVNTLQAFDGRLTGTAPGRAARDWLAGRFQAFGYDSVVIDQFTGARLWSRTPCNSYNVIACKIGGVYPDQHIIIGGHFDAVPDSPGADDNGSGAAAVLEIARVLAHVETNITIVFVAFDSEESGLLGAYHYVDNALTGNEDIVLMINADMIAHFENSDRANLCTGTEDAYALIWDQLANDRVGIDADIGGIAASDHWAFQQAGYDVLFVQEKIFSTVYHSPHDSTSYMDFEYMTRMVQATIATIYTVDQYPPPVAVTSIREPGDGTSQEVSWHRYNPSAISRYEISYYPSDTPSAVIQVDLPPQDTSYTVTNLTEIQEYALTVRLYDTAGQTSLVEKAVYFVPRSRPAPPSDILALPLREAISLTWSYNNAELDFSHCAVLRDGAVIHETLERAYVDDDPSLGSVLHNYRVVTVDDGGTICDTLDTDPFPARAATLNESRVLAVNRTQVYSADLVDETRTGEFMREALAGYDYDYFSDTAAINCQTGCVNIELNDLLDYEVIVVGAETGIWEDLGQSPAVHGVLDTLAYYLSIGGKVVIFGRWGVTGNSNTIDYRETSSPYDDAYYNFFRIESRTQTPTPWNYTDPYVGGDLVAATTRLSTYPDLVWDSLSTVAHAASQSVAVTEVEGIPCASWVQLDTTGLDILYGYDSKDDDTRSEGKPVAWRYFGPDFAFVCFDVPLSFFEPTSAKAALQQAVDELLDGAPEPWTPVDLPDGLPEVYVLYQNYPNPFNASTKISFALPEDCCVKLEVFNVLGQRVALLDQGDFRSDFYTVNWQAGGLASGVYLYRLTAGSFVQTRKMLLLK